MKRKATPRLLDESRRGCGGVNGDDFNRSQQNENGRCHYRHAANQPLHEGKLDKGGAAGCAGIYWLYSLFVLEAGVANVARFVNQNLAVQNGRWHFHHHHTR